MTCKDCVHYPMCSLCANADCFPAIEKVCIKFKDKSRFVEVKHGKWIEKETCVYQCSECGFQFTSADNICQFKFCRCGTKMDGGKT